MNKTFLILGGDRRSLFLGEYMEKKGLSVFYYGFDNRNCFDSLKEATENTNCIILPLPFTKDKTTLNTPLYKEKIKLSDIISQVNYSHLVFGGQLTEIFCRELSEQNTEYYDYFTFPELAVYNAVPTAEGVVKILIEELPDTIHNMNIAVTGFGKVGKEIAKTLKNLNADVTVIARSEKAKAECFSQGIKCISFDEINCKSEYSAVINTVPSLVLRERELETLPPGCVLIEVASTPYGIDFKSADKLGLKVIKAPSLPGKVAPKTAGEIIGKQILYIIKQKGLIV